jgi:Kef-type K+ transport system membrane component KefB
MLFLLQIVIIAASAQILGKLFRRFGQPAVAGEMTAGIALGPSLFGWVAPGLHQAVFPESSFGLLYLVGQLGLIFYMFLVGMTLDVRHLKAGRGVALAASIASIAVPFVAGFVLAAALYRRLSVPGVPLISFALFVAVCMSITAFPVLARILDETGLRNTRLGSVAIASAAFGDVVAWLILAAILAFSAPSSGQRGLGMTLAWLAAYLLGMLIFRWIWARFGFHDLASALVIALVSSIATDSIGVHALFGAFLAGVMIPKTPAFVEEMRRVVEPLTTVLFLPVFFAFTGLRTRVGLAFSWEAALILAIAVAGKWMGAMLAARAAGMETSEANALGVLMNARGLVELVVLSIGLDLGLISPRVFSMLVMMAMVTTLMTAPLVRRVYSGTKASASISTSISGSIS